MIVHYVIPSFAEAVGSHMCRGFQQCRSCNTCCPLRLVLACQLIRWVTETTMRNRTNAIGREAVASSAQIRSSTAVPAPACGPHSSPRWDRSNLHVYHSPPATAARAARRDTGSVASARTTRAVRRCAGAAVCTLTCSDPDRLRVIIHQDQLLYAACPPDASAIAAACSRYTLTRV